VLHKLGYLPFNEPFKQLFNQGMVCKLSEKSGLVEKMSKSKGNVVNPDEIVAKYGSDVLRMYVLFMGPPELDCEWQDAGLEGIKRFAHKVTDYFSTVPVVDDAQEKKEVTQRVHQFLKTYQERLDNFKPNTAISAAMELFNDIVASSMVLGRTHAQDLIVAFSVLAPHMSSELLERLFAKKLRDCAWPVYNPALAQKTEVTIAIQVNGKLRGQLVVAIDAQQKEVSPQARQIVATWLEGKEIKKEIWVPGRLISFVI
jgi:leucyl-tRNA synthetase